MHQGSLCGMLRGASSTGYVRDIGRSMGIEVGEHGELHTLPAVAWVASFGLCALGDAMMGRWVLLPLFVAGFYAGMIVIALVTYPMLPSGEAGQGDGVLPLGTSSRSADSGAGRRSS